MTSGPIPSKEELEAAACWERDDQVPGRPATTSFRRLARYRQATWREANGLPAGTQPIDPRPGAQRVRPVGSRLPLRIAIEEGANFVTPAALAAARARTETVEPQQSFDRQRLWADLLSSQALAFNVFGDLAADAARATGAVRTWVPDLAGRVRAVRFAHSPGRLDPTYLNSLRDFSAFVELELDDGSSGALGIAVRYHERNKAETPRPENALRYAEVAERSGEFQAGAVDSLLQRSDLCVMWLEHLLLLSMLQHPSGAWTWGRYLVVHPGANPDLVDAGDRYRELLAPANTFTTLTLEALLEGGSLPQTTNAAIRDRYLRS